MNIDDEIRSAMRAHDGEAPSAEALRTDLPRRRNVWPVAAAAAIVLVVPTAVVLARGWRSHPTTRPPAVEALSCPHIDDQSARYWVPSEPTAPGTSAALVPDEVPTSVVVCRYPLRIGDDSRGERVLTGDLGPVRDELVTLRDPADPTPCRAFGPAPPRDAADFLVGLSYRSGIVWLSASWGPCTGTSNGVFTARANVNYSASEAYDAGVWATSAKGARLGSDTTMVPAGPTSLTVWRPASAPGDSPKGTEVDVAGFGDLVDTINAAPTEPHTNSKCAKSTPSYRLDFGYPTGPDAGVAVFPDCGLVTNYSLDGSNVDAVVTSLQSLLAGR